MGRPLKGREDGDAWAHRELSESGMEREDTGQFFRVKPTGFTDRSDMGCDGKESRDLILDIKQNTKYLDNQKNFIFDIL